MPISTVFNEDRMLFLSRFPDGFFDLVIDDPTYGIGADKPSKKPDTVKQRNGTLLSVKQSIYTNTEWDNEPPPPEYFRELKRVSKAQIIWGVNYFDYPLPGGRIVWDKLNGMTDQFDCEIAYCSLNRRTDRFYCMWNGMIQGRYCGKVLNKALIQKGNKRKNESRIHPCQKPVLLYNYLLNTYAKTGHKICDPHMGSQSSRIAAYIGGFDYWGCEADTSFFDSGCERFRRECMGEINTTEGIIKEQRLF